MVIPSISQASRWPTVETYANWLAAQQHRLLGEQRAELAQPAEPASPYVRSAPPLVSIVTAVLNGGRFIERAILSVSKQSYPNIEHIIIDGGSKDDTLDLIQFYSDRIDLWISEPDEGIYDAINKGIVLSRGRYVKLLNADDTLPPDSVSIAAKALERTADLTCVRGNVAMIDQMDRTIEIASTGLRHPSWFLPRKVYEKVGLYRTDYQVSSDYEFFLRLQGQCVGFADLDKLLVKFRTGGASAGFVGVIESFKIDRAYNRRLVDTWSAALNISLKKTRYWLLRLLLPDNGPKRQIMMHITALTQNRTFRAIGNSDGTLATAVAFATRAVIKPPFPKRLAVFRSGI